MAADDGCQGSVYIQHVSDPKKLKVKVVNNRSKALEGYSLVLTYLDDGYELVKGRMQPNKVYVPLLLPPILPGKHCEIMFDWMGTNRAELQCTFYLCASPDGNINTAKAFEQLLFTRERPNVHMVKHVRTESGWLAKKLHRIECNSNTNGETWFNEEQTMDEPVVGLTCYTKREYTVGFSLHLSGGSKRDFGRIGESDTSTTVMVEDGKCLLNLSYKKTSYMYFWDAISTLTPVWGPKWQRTDDWSLVPE